MGSPSAGLLVRFYAGAWVEMPGKQYSYNSDFSVRLVEWGDIRTLGLPTTAEESRRMGEPFATYVERFDEYIQQYVRVR